MALWESILVVRFHFGPLKVGFDSQIRGLAVHFRTRWVEFSCLGVELGALGSVSY